MKKFVLAVIGGLTLAMTAQAQPVSQPPQTQEEAMMKYAQKGCNLKMGMWPTVSRVACAMTVFGLPQGTSPKVLATILAACQNQPHATLGACFKDPVIQKKIKDELAKIPGAPTDLTIKHPELLTPAATTPASQ